jgi:YggT family protein
LRGVVKENAAERGLRLMGLQVSCDTNPCKPEIAVTHPLLLLFNFVWFVIIAHVVMSWLINFQVLNLRQPLIAKVWYGLNQLVEPIYRPLRRILPPMQGLDLAPLVALFLLYALQYVLIRYTGLM